MNIITPPTVEPVTLTEVKNQLGITDTASDTVLTRRITEARLWVESALRRSLMPQVLELRFDNFQNEFELKAPPVSAVVSLKYVDNDGIVQTVSSADYVLDSFPLLPYVRAAYGVSWPSVRCERNAVRLQYTAGYGVTALAPAKAISAITQATPGVATSVAHGFADGDLILLTAAGMTQLNGNLYRVYAKTADTFQFANLSNDGALSTAAYGIFTSGTAQRVKHQVPALVTDAIILLVGHWTNYQSRIEAGDFITRVPAAIQQMLESEKVWNI